MWATYAPGILAGGISLFMDEVASAPYDGVNLYSRPNTPEGVRYNEALGLRKSPTIGAIVSPHLYEFVRAPKRPPLYDSYRGDANPGLTVSVARSFDDLMRIVSIRSAVYIGEQECPYDEEFDGNDASSAHLIGYVGRRAGGMHSRSLFRGFRKNRAARRAQGVSDHAAIIPAGPCRHRTLPNEGIPATLRACAKALGQFLESIWLSRVRRRA